MKFPAFLRPRRRRFKSSVDAAMEQAALAIGSLPGYAGKAVDLATLEDIARRPLKAAMKRFDEHGVVSLAVRQSPGKKRYRINLQGEKPTVTLRGQTLKSARILDHFDVRMAVEPMVFRLAAERMTPRRVNHAIQIRLTLQKIYNDKKIRRSTNGNLCDASQIGRVIAC